MAKDETLLTALLVNAAKLYNVEGVDFEMQLMECKRILDKLQGSVDSKEIFDITPVQEQVIKTSYDNAITVHSQMRDQGLKSRIERYNFLRSKGIPHQFAKCLVVHELQDGKIKLYNNAVDFISHRSIVKLHLITDIVCWYRPDKVGPSSTLFLTSHGIEVQ